MFNQRREKKDSRDNRRDGRGMRKTMGPQHRACKFCSDEKVKIDYKNEKQVQSFITERGKINHRRYTGACAKHQRAITLAIKRARILAIVPFTSTQVR